MLQQYHLPLAQSGYQDAWELGRSVGEWIFYAMVAAVVIWLIVRILSRGGKSVE